MVAAWGPPTFRPPIASESSSSVRRSLSVRYAPVKARVTVVAPGFSTPRMDMHMCLRTWRGGDVKMESWCSGPVGGAGSRRRRMKRVRPRCRHPVAGLLGLRAHTTSPCTVVCDVGRPNAITATSRRNPPASHRQRPGDVARAITSHRRPCGGRCVWPLSVAVRRPATSRPRRAEAVQPRHSLSHKPAHQVAGQGAGRHGGITPQRWRHTSADTTHGPGRWQYWTPAPL